MKQKMMKSFLIGLGSVILSSSAFAALPAQFSECLSVNSTTMASFTDLRDMAKAAKMTYCQTQVSLIGSPEVKELLRSNVDVGISLGRMTYSQRELLDMAQAGPYLLYVDATKLSRLELTALAQAGVQLVVMASSSGLSQSDLVALAGTKSFIYNVDALVSKSNIQDLVNLGVQIVIRSGSALSKQDAVAIAQTNSSLVTFLP